MGPESFTGNGRTPRLGRVADGRELAIEEKTRSVNVTILTPWAPVEGKLTLAVFLGVDGVLSIGSTFIRNRLGIDALVTLKHRFVKRARTGGVSPGREVIEAAGVCIAGGAPAQGKDIQALPGDGNIGTRAVCSG